MRRVACLTLGSTVISSARAWLLIFWKHLRELWQDQVRFARFQATPDNSIVYYVISGWSLPGSVKEMTWRPFSAGLRRASFPNRPGSVSCFLRLFVRSFASTLSDCNSTFNPRSSRLDSAMYRQDAFRMISPRHSGALDGVLFASSANALFRMCSGCAWRLRKRVPISRSNDFRHFNSAGLLTTISLLNGSVDFWPVGPSSFGSRKYRSLKSGNSLAVILLKSGDNLNWSMLHRVNLRLAIGTMFDNGSGAIANQVLACSGVASSR